MKKIDLGISRRHLILAGTGAAAYAAAGAHPSFAAEPYRIGALNPITGAGSAYGTGMQKSILFATEEVNAAGGPAGRQFLIFPGDDQTNADAGVLAAKKMLGADKVDAVIGPWSSPVCLAIMPFLNEANKIFLFAAGAHAMSKVRQKELSWRFQSHSLHYGYALAKAARELGGQRVATMALNNPSAIDGIDGATKLLKDWKKDITGRVIYEPGRPSYRSELQSLLARNPDVLVSYSFLPDFTVLLREWYEMGGTRKIVTPSFAANAQLVAALGPEVTEGIVAVTTVPEEGAPAYKRFEQKYRESMGKDVGDNIYAAGCYDMIHILALAIEASGPGADNLKIVSNIHRVANEPGKKVSSFAEGKPLIMAGEKVVYEGALGTLNFDETGDAMLNYIGSMIEKGKVVRRWQFKTTT